MRSKSTGDKKYPKLITLTDGTEILLPRQSKFTDPWLRQHGCSLVAEFEALQWLGVKKEKHWPIYLEEWHRDNTPEEVYAKVTVRGVAEGLKHYGKGRGRADYITTPTEERIQAAIDAGHVVILEQGDPIHTVTLLPDKKGIYVANAGTVRRTTAKAKAKKATTSKRYRGMVIVKRSEK